MNERKISLIILTKNKVVFLKAECFTQVWEESDYPTDKMKLMKKWEANLGYLNWNIFQISKEKD